MRFKDEMNDPFKVVIQTLETVVFLFSGKTPNACNRVGTRMTYPCGDEIQITWSSY